MVDILEQHAIFGYQCKKIWILLPNKTKDTEAKKKQRREQELLKSHLAFVILTQESLGTWKR